MNELRVHGVAYMYTYKKGEGNTKPSMWARMLESKDIRQCVTQPCYQFESNIQFVNAATRTLAILHSHTNLRRMQISILTVYVAHLPVSTLVLATQRQIPMQTRNHRNQIHATNCNLALILLFPKCMASSAVL